MGLLGGGPSPVGICPKCREETAMDAENFTENFVAWRCDNCGNILGVSNM